MSIKFSLDDFGDNRGGRWQRGGRYNSRRSSRSGYRGGRSRGRGYHPRSRLEDEEGDIDMGYEKSNRGRSHPYGQSQNRRGYRERSPTQDIDSDAEWWKVIVLDGSKHSSDWLFKRLQTLCTSKLSPVNKHIFRDNVVFFVDNFEVADSLKKGSKRITTRNGSKIEISVRPGKPTRMQDQADEPVVIETDAEKLDILKQFLGARYDPNLIKLDLSDIYNDPILIENRYERRIYDTKLVNTILKLIHDICPQLKILNVSNNRISALRVLNELPNMCPVLEELDLSENKVVFLSDLSKFKTMEKLNVLHLKGNPACREFQTDSLYHAEIRQHLPKVEIIDGVKLPPAIKVNLDTSCSLPTYKENYTANEDATVLIRQFLINFFRCYDAEDINDRQQLLDAYHNDATFSMSINMSVFVEDRNSVSFFDVKKSRNLVKLRDRNVRQQIIKNKKLSVVAYLTEFPKTKHKLETFSLDVTLVTPACVSFVVHGVYLEGDTSVPRGFTRSFIVVPESKAANPFSIINDALVIRNATEKQLKKLNVTESVQQPVAVQQPITTTSSHGVSLEQQALVQKFSGESKMNEKWSHDALHQNGWDYAKAAAKFTELKAGGKIPQEAFLN